MSQGESHPQEMNDLLGMTLGLEHPGHVRGTRYGATITSYFHQPRGHQSSTSSDDVKRLVDALVKKMGKIHSRARLVVSSFSISYDTYLFHVSYL